MFHGKLRIHTCRVILLTSLVWFLIDVAILSFYTECPGGVCKKSGEYNVEVQEPLVAKTDEQTKLKTEKKNEENRYIKHLTYRTALTRFAYIQSFLFILYDATFSMHSTFYIALIFMKAHARYFNNYLFQSS